MEKYNYYLDINFKDRTSEVEALYEPTLKDIKADPEMYAELVNDLLFHWVYGTRETPLMVMVKKQMKGEMAEGGMMEKGGNVRSLLSQFQKEKPSILIQMIADDVASDFMRDKFDKSIVWDKLSDFEKKKYNEVYRENKSDFEKYLIYEFVKLYYSDGTIKNKCKGNSRATISAIKSVMVSLAKDYPSSKYAEGGMMAKGGLTEHGLKIGDEIYDISKNDRNSIYVMNNLLETNKTTYALVDLENGKRIEGIYADGGVMGKGGLFGDSRYNYGRSWTLDHRQHNKGESYEIPLKKRKRKY